MAEEVVRTDIIIEPPFLFIRINIVNTRKGNAVLAVDGIEDLNLEWRCSFFRKLLYIWKPGQ